MRFAESLCAENYTDFTCMGEEQDDFLQLQDSVQELRDAFPELKVRVVDSFQDKDYVIWRSSFVGTQRGEYDDFAPLDQVVEWESIDILHFQDEILLERWAQSDLLAQLEAPEAEEEEAVEDTQSAEFSDLQHRVYGVLDVAGLVRKALEHDREHFAALSGAEV